MDFVSLEAFNIHLIRMSIINMAQFAFIFMLIIWNFVLTAKLWEIGQEDNES